MAMPFTWFSLRNLSQEQQGGKSIVVCQQQIETSLTADSVLCTLSLCTLEQVLQVAGGNTGLTNTQQPPQSPSLDHF